MACIMFDEKLINLLQEAYLEGFNSSGEGYNGEFGANVKDRDWLATRNTTLDMLIAKYFDQKDNENV